MVALMAETSSCAMIRQLSIFVRSHSPHPDRHQRAKQSSVFALPTTHLDQQEQQHPVNGKPYRRATISTVPAPSLVPPSSSSSYSARISTLSGEFQQQLTSLMTKINRTSPHYIRCIKPNENNEGNVFDPHLVLNQLNCSGVLECIRVTRAGYPVKMLFEEFLWQYRCLVPGACNEVKSVAKRASLSSAISTLYIAKCAALGDEGGRKVEFVTQHAEVYALCILLAQAHVSVQHNKRHHQQTQEESRDAWDPRTWRSSPKKSDSDKTWRHSPEKPASSSSGSNDAFQTWRLTPAKKLVCL